MSDITPALIGIVLAQISTLVQDKFREWRSQRRNTPVYQAALYKTLSAHSIAEYMRMETIPNSGTVTNDRP